jgi:hypothetical protein
LAAAGICMSSFINFWTVLVAISLAGSTSPLMERIEDGMSSSLQYSYQRQSMFCTSGDLTKMSVGSYLPLCFSLISVCLRQAHQALCHSVRGLSILQVRKRFKKRQELRFRLSPCGSVFLRPCPLSVVTLGPNTVYALSLSNGIPNNELPCVCRLSHTPSVSTMTPYRYQNYRYTLSHGHRH